MPLTDSAQLNNSRLNCSQHSPAAAAAPRCIADVINTGANGSATCLTTLHVAPTILQKPKTATTLHHFLCTILADSGNHSPAYPTGSVCVCLCIMCMHNITMDPVVFGMKLSQGTAILYKTGRLDPAMEE